MRPQHIDVAEAVRIHQLLDAKHSLGIHWGTYEMGSWEPYNEPPAKLREEAEKAGLKDEEFFTIEHEETWSAEGSENATAKH